MIAIVYATAQEAQPFLDLTGLTPLDQNELPCFGGQDSGMVVVVCGMGKVAAAIGTQYLLHHFDIRRVIHAGVCGALQTGPPFEPGAVFCMASTTEGHSHQPGSPTDPPACDTSGFSHLPQARLVTVGHGVFDDTLKAQLAQWGDLVDMEGAVVARVAALFKRPCTIVKGITDFAGRGQRALLKKRLGQVSREVAGQLHTALTDLQASKGVQSIV